MLQDLVGENPKEEAHLEDLGVDGRMIYDWLENWMRCHELEPCNCGQWGKKGGVDLYNPYPTAFPYGNGMVLHFYQQQESGTIKTVHKVINKGLKTYVQSLHTGENFH